MTGQTMSVRTAVILLGFLMTSRASAQAPQHFPLDHRVPPGVLSHFHAISEPGLYGSPQPVEILLPQGGQVTFLNVTSDDGTPQPAPARATFLVGHVYQVRISDLPGLPGVELYPTIELVHRLHPPADLVDEFPVPVDVTAEEIRSALDDRMVTKVIYLERPDIAAPVRQEVTPRVTDLRPSANLIETATNLGRPIAVLRMGGRIPLSSSPDAWPAAAGAVQFPAIPRE